MLLGSASCTDSFPKMDEGNSCIMCGYLLPSLFFSIFQPAGHGNILTAYQTPF